MGKQSAIDLAGTQCEGVIPAFGTRIPLTEGDPLWERDRLAGEDGVSGYIAAADPPLSPASRSRSHIFDRSRARILCLLKIPVGAGLPAKAECQSTSMQLTRRLRWQASSHRGLCKLTITRVYWLNAALFRPSSERRPEQARSYRVCVSRRSCYLTSTPATDKPHPRFRSRGCHG